jgi:hypothetical protein
MAESVSPETSTAYASNWEHLQDELRRLDLVIRLRRMHFLNRAPENPFDKFKGIVMSEEEITGLLADERKADSSPEITARTEDLDKLTEEIKRRIKASEDAGVVLWLPRASFLFRLSPLEESCLLICLAPEIRRKYERLYAYLQDDMTQKSPTIDLVLRLTCFSDSERFDGMQAFHPDAALLKYRLVEIADAPESTRKPLPSRTLRLNSRIADFLVGGPAVDPRLEGIVRETEFPPARSAEVEGAIVSRLRSLVQAQLAGEHGDRRLVLNFHGPQLSGKRQIAEALAGEIGRNLISVDAAAALASKTPFAELIWLAVRESTLRSGVLCLENADLLPAGDDAAGSPSKVLLEAVGAFCGMSFILGSQPWLPRASRYDFLFVPVEFAPLPPEARRALWEEQLDPLPVEGYIDVAALSSKFRFTQAQILYAIRAARDRARWRSEGEPAITEDDLYAACRSFSEGALNTLARKIKPRARWADLVLPVDSLEQLHELANWVEYRDLVLGEWGFGERLSRGKGVNALFAGPTGTGKTMAAEVIANELGLDLYRIDLSQVVSKYIGETEKNLEAIFTAGDRANAILLFDEADALFGKRSEVRDSHDRYANLEISYLLQRMEEYEGVAILASNLRQNLDEAFVRRLAFTIHFPFPDERARRLMWTAIWPAEVTLAGDVDLGFMARQFRLSGGSIRNIALAAAFLAAPAGLPVTMDNLLQGTRREYQKLGKELTPAELGQVEPELAA